MRLRNCVSAMILLKFFAETLIPILRLRTPFAPVADHLGGVIHDPQATLFGAAVCDVENHLT